MFVDAHSRNILEVSTRPHSKGLVREKIFIVNMQELFSYIIILSLKDRFDQFDHI